MNELGIFVNDSRVVVSSRDVARIFEKEHKHVIRDIEALSCSDAFRASNFGPVYKTMPNGAQIIGRTEQYLITRDGFTFLAMGFTGAKASKFKEAYIAAFNKMEEELKGKFTTEIPSSFAEALELAAKVVREKEALAAKIKEDEHKVTFAESVEECDSNILMREMATIATQAGFPVGQNTLFEILRQEGLLVKYGSSKNHPTQRGKDLGIFHVRETLIAKPNGAEELKRTTMVTGKGQLYILKLLKKKYNQDFGDVAENINKFIDLSQYRNS